MGNTLTKLLGKIICFTNNKGGSAKTSTLINVARILVSVFGLKVLVIDVDPQANATNYILKDLIDDNGEAPYPLLDGRFNIDKNSSLLFDKNFKKEDANSLIIHHKQKGFDIIPARQEDLLSVDNEVHKVLEEINTQIVANNKATKPEMKKIAKGIIENNTDTEEILKKNMLSLKDKYDIILIDVPNYISKISKSAWAVSNFLFIPVGDIGALEGTGGLLNNMSNIKKKYNPMVKFIFFYTRVNRYSNRFGLFLSDRFKYIIDYLETSINSNAYLKSESYIMKQQIGHSNDVDTANLLGESLIDIFKRKTITKDLVAFTKELLSILGVTPKNKK